MPEPVQRSESHERFAARTTGDPAAALEFAVAAARMLADDKCESIVLLDVRELSQVTDYIVIGNGTSERQMRSVLTHVEELGGQMGYPPFRASDDERATWLLADFVDVVVHIFEPNTRAHYDLEMLWGDAPRIAWERPGDAPRNRAGLKRGDEV
jgi:ribosome-associated protein